MSTKDQEDKYLRARDELKSKLLKILEEFDTTNNIQRSSASNNYKNQSLGQLVSEMMFEYKRE